MKPFLPSVLLLGIVASAFADSSTWDLNPTSSDWNTAANWTPNTVPNGPADVATFQSSNQTAIALSASVEVAGLIFDAGAPSYVISPARSSILTMSDTGITNNSGQLQSFTTSVDNRGHFSQIQFTNSASAGSNTVFDNLGGGFEGAETDFFDNSTADQATLTNHGGSVFGAFTRFAGSSSAGQSTITSLASQISLGGAGHTEFSENATADRATITCEGGLGSFLFPGTVLFQDFSSAGDSVIVGDGADALFATGAFVTFDDSSSAGSATVVANGGSQAGATIQFLSGSSASNATLIANGVAPQIGGVITFAGPLSGGQARVKLNGTGSLDISAIPLSLTIGSIEGTGNVHLGSSELTIGANGINTTFSGVIDGAGSLVKIGRGRVTLSGVNTYTGGTTIDAGSLLVANRNNSATGAGPVQVNKGMFGGVGQIAGAVTIGNGTANGAVFSPGVNNTHPASLFLRGPLTLRSFSTYQLSVDSANSAADKVTVNGVTIEIGAIISLKDIGNGALADGTVFTIINNRAPGPISGTFNNLPDGGTITVGTNTFQANYSGGDGNDLTLTVVP